MLLILTGIGGQVSAATVAGARAGRWERLREQDLRVARVAYRLAVANQALCRGALAPQLGFVLHALDQYEPADREEAARSFVLGSHVGVMAVVAGSPAEKAGLRADDQLLAVNGRMLGGPGTPRDGAPTPASVERARKTLLDEMGKGETTLRIAGAQGVRDLRFSAEKGCRSSVELAPGEGVNAWADGERVVVGAGIVERCATDEDLALVIAHELAHNLLRHGHDPAAGGAKSRMLMLPQAGLGAMRGKEEEADRLAVRLATAAAYDLEGAASFLGALLKEDGAGPAASTHPETERRLALLDAAIDAEKRRAGL